MRTTIRSLICAVVLLCVLCARLPAVRADSTDDYINQIYQDQKQTDDYINQIYQDQRQTDDYINQIYQDQKQFNDYMQQLQDTQRYIDQINQGQQ